MFVSSVMKQFVVVQLGGVTIDDRSIEEMSLGVSSSIYSGLDRRCDIDGFGELILVKILIFL